jgi:uroporphyrinogen-III synthase
MNSFSDFNIDTNILVGDKVKIQDIINLNIEVHVFKIMPSKHPKDGFEQCLHLQIKLDDKDFVIFTSSNVLIEQIKKVPDDGLPFTAKIIKSGKCLRFTN